MIDLEGVNFGYGRERLFGGLKLRLEPGNIYGLLGVNGAGKSSLLKLMSGLLFAEAGSVRVLGFEPARRTPALLSELFVLPEELNLPNVTMRAYLAARAPFYPRFDHAQFARYLRELELPAGHRLPALSYGQKKKFLLAFGLACRSSVLLMDEPTNGLDIPSKGQFRRLIAEALTDERLFVISTHQVRDVASLIDPIVILHAGRVLLSRSMSEIETRVRMEHTPIAPPADAEGLLHSEPGVGGYWSVWRGDGTEGGQIDLEVLFNMLIARPDLGRRLFEHAAQRAAAACAADPERTEGFE
ncbi:MAG TPA: ABC transporter ATP-binding protein [Gammaproteobacteria bacterium]|nr:ABC transporter ATP-binding protein [Gammaproteobacteria bacterium]